MNWTKEIAALNKRLDRTLAQAIAQRALMEVLTAKVALLSPKMWRVELDDLALAARYDIASMDLANMPAGDEESLRDAAREALAAIMAEMKSAMADAERAGLLSCELH